jgi:beta-mannosidase
MILPICRYPVNDAFLLNVRNEILYQVQRLRSHLSIVLWTENNENEMILAMYSSTLPPETTIESYISIR